MADQYPKRSSFFANKFCRLMTKVCVANCIGSDAAFLLMTVAMTEDAKSYRSPVTFFNEQLMPLIGCKSVDSLVRVRSRAIASGWLHYEAGGKGIPGKYWVTIPNEFAQMDDAPVDENRAEYGEFTTADLRRQPRDKQVSHRMDAEESLGEVRQEAEDKCGKNPRRSAEHSSSSFSSSEPREERPPVWANGEHTLFAEFWKAYPRKARRPEAARAFLDLNPDRQLLHAMLAAVEVQSHSPQWIEKSGEFIPFPAKWLRERGWEDLPPEKLRPATTNVIYDTL